jgi:hypothetical protein
LAHLCVQFLDRRKRVISYAVCVACLLAVPAVGFIAGLLYLGDSIKNFTPASPNDQVSYFLQSQAFCDYGFDTGYFTIEERPAAASFSHLGVHGPLFPILYGTLGRWFGLAYASGPLFNVLLLTLAIGAYCGLCRPSKRRLLWLGLFLLTFWPYYVFLYSWMQETTHFAIAVVLAGVFTALLSDLPWSRTTLFRTAALLFVCVAALLRISWALMLPPLLVLIWQPRTRRAIVCSGIASLGGILALLVIFRWLCAPYGSHPTAFMMTRLVTLDVRLVDFLALLFGNAAQFKRPDSLLDRILLDQQWGSVAVSGVLTALIAVVHTTNWKWIRFCPQQLFERPGYAMFCCYNQTVVMFATVTTYYVGNGGGLRIFSIHLLLTMLIAAAAPQRALRFLFLSVIAYNIMMCTPSLSSVRSMLAPCFSSAKSTADFRKTIDGIIVFAPGADGWKNTVLSDRIPPQFAGMTPGIGLSLILNHEALSKPKARYIIATPFDVAKAKIRVKLLCKLEGISGEIEPPALSQPNLYLNLEPWH